MFIVKDPGGYPIHVNSTRVGANSYLYSILENRPDILYMCEVIEIKNILKEIYYFYRYPHLKIK